MNDLDKVVEELYLQIVSYCSPYGDDNANEVAFDMFFVEYTFAGGMNDKHQTLHENMFAMMYPELYELQTTDA
ncbi:hypothetical protein B8A39_08680 [Dolosigranulum pigrum]|jgi:hypothetical protein|uniref:hypothetical protein n=1 Tax=Dolosigranulum pigrum TaxID=29394 RepID=UPI000DBF5563|nr:hypothetical protein [Dolosigranulum pigrum]QTJ34465.1 hypothetical protein FE322_03605 [Dolosigranulum pigrum]QTJ37991.1 hypothetical protein FE324_04050 [Dolosigranulum pigrum]QTJ39646.1 hypothetical protein FE325_03585 [Dolosigranulum pigrum]QTJ48137.1 hypothetical protein FE330_03600 [Dolosigranulum pigrum]RAN50830.1 hypothetical protein B8A39_08680 [Dolosigranulum pigrum]